MSSFLSQIHYDLYERIKYSDCIANELSNLLKDKKHIHMLEISTLPNKALEDVIDLGQIHYWLLNCIQEVENRLSYLFTTCIKEGLQQECEHLFHTLGIELSNTTIETAIQALQYMQHYMLDGMPCDHGVQIIHADEKSVSFIIASDVHMQIDMLDEFINMRFIWMKAVLSKSKFVLFHEDMSFEIRKEDEK